MQDMKQALANAVRTARTELGLSQEKLAENLGLDTRTILNIEAGRGNPMITYLKIPADTVFYPGNEADQPNLQKLLAVLKDCTESEADALLPAARYMLDLLRKN